MLLEDNNPSLGRKVIIPIPRNSWEHWTFPTLSFVYIYEMDSYREIVLSQTHNDVPPADVQDYLSRTGKDNIIFRKKTISRYCHGLDLEMLYWLSTNMKMEVNYPATIRQYWNWYPNDSVVNDCIPIMKWLEFCRDLKDTFVSATRDLDLEADYVRKYDSLLFNLSKIESNGLFVSQ